MAESKNFRTQFLGKVGIKGVEEKTILENIVQETSVDLWKLSQFCLRMRVPVAQQKYVWALILGVKCSLPELDSFFRGQLEEQFKNLSTAAQTLLTCNKDYENINKEALMNLILIGYFPACDLGVENSKLCSYFCDVYKVMSSIDEDSLQAFWLSAKFSKKLFKFKEYILTMENNVALTLKKEDTDDQLYEHLSLLNAFHDLPLQHWLNTAFASVLTVKSVGAIWDKVISGCSLLLLYTSVALFLVCKQKLLAASEVKEIQTILEDLSQEAAELVSSQAVELWNRNGGLLHPEVPVPIVAAISTDVTKYRFAVCESPLADLLSSPPSTD